MMKRVFVLGDSISIHYGPHLERYLLGFMHYSRKEGEDKAVVQLDQPLVANANAGDSSMCLEYLQQRLGLEGSGSTENTGNLQQADFILFNAGLHDIKTRPGTNNTQVPVDEYERNLIHIIQLIRRALPNAELIWIRTTPIDETLHNTRQKNFHRHEKDLMLYNETADRVMCQFHVRQIDLYQFTRNIGPSKAIFCDHVHFHSHVREKQAAFIAGWLCANTTK